MYSYTIHFKCIYSVNYTIQNNCETKHYCDHIPRFKVKIILFIRCEENSFMKLMKLILE